MSDPQFAPPDSSLAAICFDLDDTLFDYEQYIEAGLREAAAVIESETGTDLESELLTLYFEDDVRDGTFDVLIDRHDLPDGLTPRLVEAYHSSSEQLTPYDETERVLSTLGDTYRLGLITDGRNARSKLRRLGLTGHFETIFEGPAHGIDKTDVRPFREVLSELDVDPEGTLYIGDNPHTDFRHPNALGMYTVRLRRGRYVDRDPRDGESPDAVIDSLSELLTLLDED